MDCKLDFHTLGRYFCQLALIWNQQGQGQQMCPAHTRWGFTCPRTAIGYNEIFNGCIILFVIISSTYLECNLGVEVGIRVLKPLKPSLGKGLCSSSAATMLILWGLFGFVCLVIKQGPF